MSSVNIFTAVANKTFIT